MEWGGVIIDSIASKGTEGQILKIRENSITPDNNFRVLRVVDNDTDFNNEKSKGIVTMETIFNQWNRNVSYYKPYMEIIFGDAGASSTSADFNGVNTKNLKNQFNVTWSFNDPYIVQNSNNDALTAFISPEKYSTYTVELLLTVTKADDDAIGVVIGSINSGTQNWHGLFLQRQLNTTSVFTDKDLHTEWILCYDANMPTYKIVSNNSKVFDFGYTNVFYKYVKIKITRTGRSILAESTQYSNDINSLVYNPSGNISYTLPTSKPSDWSNDMWNNINKILGEPSNIGLFTVSNICNFRILNSNLFNDNKIYRLDTDQLYDYVNNSYQVTGKVSDEIPYWSWLYNSNTKKLFNYSGKQSYTLIDY